MSNATEAINVGRPVEWMVEKGTQQRVLGVTYLFSLTGESLTVWYTEDGMPAEQTIRVTCLGDLLPAKEDVGGEASPA